MALTDNLVAYWTLDGNSNDSVGSSNGSDTDITYASGNGKLGQGASFNGSTSLIAPASSTGLGVINGSNPMSVAAWIQPKYTGASNKDFITKWSGANQSWLIDKSDGNNKFRFLYKGAAQICTANSAFTINTWYHVVVTVSNGATQNIKMYVNGSLQTSQPSFAQSFPNNGDPIQFGSHEGSNFNTMYLDEVGIWNKVLSQTEVDSLYNGGSGLAYPLAASSVSSSPSTSTSSSVSSSPSTSISSSPSTSVSSSVSSSPSSSVSPSTSVSSSVSSSPSSSVSPSTSISSSVSSSPSTSVSSSVSPSTSISSSVSSSASSSPSTSVSSSTSSSASSSASSSPSSSVSSSTSSSPSPSPSPAPERFTAEIRHSRTFTPETQNDQLVAWNIDGARYSQSFSFYADTFGANASEMIQFKPNGLRFYLASVGKVFQFDMSTAWDISTATLAGITSFTNTASSGYISPDGTNLYIIKTSNDNVGRYVLSTPWDITTHDAGTFTSIAAQDTAPEGISFKTDGTVMYTTGNQGDEVNQWTLATPWDVSTATFSQRLSTSPALLTIDGMFMRDDGLKMYIADFGYPATVWEYTLATAWDISTATQTDLYTKTSGGYTYCVWFKPDGTKMYLINDFTYSVDEYDLALKPETKNSVTLTAESKS